MSDAEAVLRREAARRRLAGESPEAIAQDLGRTRQWVAKWAGRYDPENPSWAEGRSRAPKHVADRTPEDIAERVLAVRGRLAENPWAQVGAEAISWELSKLGGPAAAPPAHRALRAPRRSPQRRPAPTGSPPASHEPRAPAQRCPPGCGPRHAWAPWNGPQPSSDSQGHTGPPTSPPTAWYAPD